MADAGPALDWRVRPGPQMPAEELVGVTTSGGPDGSAGGVQTGLGDPFSLGWAGVLADGLGGRPVVYALPPGRMISTVSVHLDLVRGCVEPPAGLSGTGRLVELNDDWAVSRFTVADPHGHDLVHGSTRFVVHPERDLAAEPSTGSAAGPEPATDLPGLLGLQSHGGALTFRPARRYSNPYGVVHGGVHIALVDAAMTDALDADPVAALVLHTLDVYYHRPIPVDGGPVIAAGTVYHRGGRTALVDATLTGPDGTVLTTARGGFGRPGQPKGNRP